MATRCSSQRPDRVIALSGGARLPRQGAGFRDVAPAMLLLAIGLVGLLAAYLSGNSSSGQYLVIAAPGASYGRVIHEIRSADGDLAALGGFGNIAIAASSRSDFPQRVKQAGAWLVLPAPRISGCFGLQSEASRS